MKTIYKTAIRAAALLAVCTSTLAVAADFSGTWVRDNAVSKVPPYPSYWVTRSAGGGGFGNNQAVMEVRQTDAAIQVTDPVHPSRTYTLDGRDHGRATDTGIGRATVVARMQGDTLTVATTEPFGGMPGNVAVTSRETWTVSPDRRMLTIATVRETPALKQTYIEVFNRR